LYKQRQDGSPTGGRRRQKLTQVTGRGQSRINERERQTKQQKSSRLKKKYRQSMTKM